MNRWLITKMVLGFVAQAVAFSLLFWTIWFLFFYCKASGATLRWDAQRDANAFQVEWGFNRTNLTNRILVTTGFCDVAVVCFDPVRCDVPVFTNRVSYYAVRALITNSGAQSELSEIVSYYQYQFVPCLVTLSIPASKQIVSRGSTLNSMVEVMTLTGPTNLTWWTTNGGGEFYARRPFFAPAVASPKAGQLKTVKIAKKPVRAKFAQTQSTNTASIMPLPR